MNYNSDMEEQFRIYIEDREYSEFSFINANSLEIVVNPGIDPVEKKPFLLKSCICLSSNFNSKEF